jgi:trans-aconitate methyltransferase
LGELLGADVPYHGLDFSKVALAQAQDRVPHGTFQHVDLREWVAPKPWPWGSVAVTEVLEHIQGDLQLLEKLPHGVLVVASVPRFWCPGHVRRFDTAQQVRCRYGEVLKFDELVPLGERHFVFRGVRR